MMKHILFKNKYIILFFILFSLVVSQRFLNYRENGLQYSISSDGRGYYCYLPAAIIYQDFTYSFFDKPKNKINYFYKPDLDPYKDKFVNKYYCGTSICFLPFFLLAIVISYIAGTDINGYTDTFLMLISISSIVYYLLSLVMLSKIGRFFSISEKYSFLFGLIIMFGTNLYHYVIQEPSMSHAYSFFAVTLFFYLYTKLYKDIKWKNFIYLGLALSIVFLIRPVNITVILFTPFFSSSFKDYLSFIQTVFKKHFVSLLLFIFIIVLAVCLQFTFYYFQTGDFYLIAYEGESFNFTNPQIINTLFSYRKGLFLYVPITAFLIFLISISKLEIHQKGSFFITLTVFLYITSSWWCWWYGDGLSIRPIVDILPVFAISASMIFNKYSSFLKMIFLTSHIPFIFFTQFIMYQYSHEIMDKFNMNKEKYFDIFLKYNMASVNETKINYLLKNSTILKQETLDYENIANENIKNNGYGGGNSCIVGEKNEYSIGFVFPLNNIRNYNSFYVISECFVKTDDMCRELELVTYIDDNGNTTRWSPVYRYQFNEGENGWTKMTNVVKFQDALLKPDNHIKIFVRCNKGENFVDNLGYKVVNIPASCQYINQ